MSKEKVKLNIIYIQEAKRIVINYKELLKQFESLENTLLAKQKIINDFKNELDNITKSSSPEQIKINQINSAVTEYEKDIIIIQNEIQPYVSKFEQLKKDSEILYKILKEKYPYDDETLKQIVHDNITASN